MFVFVSIKNTAKVSLASGLAIQNSVIPLSRVSLRSCSVSTSPAALLSANCITLSCVRYEALISVVHEASLLSVSIKSIAAPEVSLASSVKVCVPLYFPVVLLRDCLLLFSILINILFIVFISSNSEG